MVAIQIRDVPDDVRDALTRAAKAQGQSLQSYLLTVLQRQADAAHNAELLRAWSPPRGATDAKRIDVVELIAQQRRERDEQLVGNREIELP